MADKRQHDGSQAALSRRKAQDRSIALVLTGLVLLLPPVGAIALLDANILGLPLPLVYVFTVWAVLIAGGAVLARPLHEHSSAPEAVPEIPTAND